MTSNRVLGRIIQVAAAVVLCLGVLLCALELAAAVSAPKPPEGLALVDVLRYLWPALSALMLGLALAGVMTVGAGWLLRAPQAPAALLEPVHHIEQQVQSLYHEIRQTALWTHQIASRSPSAPPEPAPVGAPAATPTAPAPALTDTLQPQVERVIALLEEMREVSLLDESQRQERLRQYMEHRRQITLQQIVWLLQQNHWARADQMLSLLKQQFPDDAQTQQVQRMLDEARASAQAATFRAVKGEVEELLAISSWDHALHAVQRFQADFPGHPDGQQLLARVTRERDLFRESTVQRLFDEVRRDVERRNWRLAQSAAQRLIERFPEHHRTQQIRLQMRVIQDNAEIEERQEQEAQIQELVRNKQFREAIELGEQMMRRYPLSPQADQLETLLPKLHDLAVQEETAQA